MTSLKVLTRSGTGVYVERLQFEEAQAACDLALILIRRGYCVNLRVENQTETGESQLTTLKR